MRIKGWAALALVGVLAAGCGQKVDPASSARAHAVLQRTKTNRGTYAIYNWNRVTPPGGAASESWAAEFNAGPLHRVEVPNIRVAADCDAHTATMRDTASGTVTTDPATADVACGISTAKPISRMEWLGETDTRYGKADRIRVTDADTIRTYTVDKDGVILAASFSSNTFTHPVTFETQAYALSREPLDKAMFDPGSLDKVFAPEAYRTRAGYPH